jgi:hypothetical protein
MPADECLHVPMRGDELKDRQQYHQAEQLGGGAKDLKRNEAGDASRRQ